MENQEIPKQENINQSFNQQFGQQNLPNSTTVLVLGIISIVGCFCYGFAGIVLGIIAIVLAVKSQKLYDQNPGLYSDASLKNMKAGKVCAIVGLSLSVVYIVFIIIYFMFIGSMLMGTGTGMPWGMMK